MPIPPKTVAGRERTAHSLQCSDVTKPRYRGGCTAIRSGVLKHQPQDRGPRRIMACVTAGASSPHHTAAGCGTKGMPFAWHSSGVHTRPHALACPAGAPLLGSAPAPSQYSIARTLLRPLLGAAPWPWQHPANITRHRAENKKKSINISYEEIFLICSQLVPKMFPICSQNYL